MNNVPVEALGGHAPHRFISLLIPTAKVPTEIWLEICWWAIATSEPVNRNTIWLSLARTNQMFRSIVCSIANEHGWLYLSTPLHTSATLSMRDHPLHRAAHLTVVINTRRYEYRDISAFVETLLSVHGRRIEELIIEGQQWADLLPPCYLPNLKSLVFGKGAGIPPKALITNPMFLLHAILLDGGFKDIGIHCCHYLVSLQYAPNTWISFLNDIAILSQISTLKKLTVFSPKDEWDLDPDEADRSTATLCLPSSLSSLHVPWELVFLLQEMPPLPSLLEFGVGDSNSAWQSGPGRYTDDVTPIVTRCPAIQAITIHDARESLALGLPTHWQKIVDLEVTEASVPDSWTQRCTLTRLRRLTIHAIALSALSSISAPELVRLEIRQSNTTPPSAVPLNQWLEQHRETQGSQLFSLSIGGLEYRDLRISSLRGIPHIFLHVSEGLLTLQEVLLQCPPEELAGLSSLSITTDSYLDFKLAPPPCLYAHVEGVRSMFPLALKHFSYTLSLSPEQIEQLRWTYGRWSPELI
ncbi:hypothetical protein CYLTODRAFT_456256 [Cylindrobasidium torrendii FP15055 ss-10]|uniref:Uncharacterized protein n=1 Tax=Cylindrobasidium torrendii FP15055 ss-10 TaxID=1314674 RepID=A0A0D7B7G8_9AGAR|nr:hypothetical protein CYLTODRAFT_456256 [Cylindrobasidium torrendii FP15055 ss-10]